MARVWFGLRIYISIDPLVPLVLEVRGSKVPVLLEYASVGDGFYPALMRAMTFCIACRSRAISSDCLSRLLVWTLPCGRWPCPYPCARSALLVVALKWLIHPFSLEGSRRMSVWGLSHLLQIDLTEICVGPRVRRPLPRGSTECFISKLKTSSTHFSPQAVPSAPTNKLRHVNP